MVMQMKMSDLTPELTAEELADLEKAERMPNTFDADSPAMTAEQLAQFKRTRRDERIRHTISMRLSPKAWDFSQTYGKGYTSFLSRLIDAALDDEELVRKCI